jgi:acyl carrier protein
MVTAMHDGKDGITTKVRGFVHSRFPLAKERKIPDDASLLEAGIVDSLGILSLVAFVEETFSVRIEDEELSPENFESVEALSRFVRSKQGCPPHS